MRTISLLVVLCAIWNIGCAQSFSPVGFDIQIDYKMSYLPDSNSVTIREEYMELLVNDMFSLFQSKSKGRLDSAHHASKRGEGSMVPEGFWSVNRTAFHYQILKTGDSIITRDEYRLRKNYEYHYYLDRKDTFDWVIKGDTSTIAGLMCQKAEVDFGGRKWIAWFTPEIPIADGPYKFCGLPGLILTLVDTTGSWQFAFVGIKNVNINAIVTYDSKITTPFISKQRFFEEKRKYLVNKTVFEEAAGVIIMQNEKDRMEAVKRDRERATNDNNWIELYP